VLVGAAHLSFYGHWAETGMNQNPNVHLISTTFGVGNEHKVLPANQSDGMLIANNWAPENPSVPENKAFLADWTREYGDTEAIHEIAVSQYQGIHLWAEAVRQAGAVDRDSITKTLENGLAINGPAGVVKMDPLTHHCSLDIHIMELNNQKLDVVQKFEQREPLDTRRFCNLSENPDSNLQYEITL